jgi:hypothetical protein
VRVLIADAASGLEHANTPVRFAERHLSGQNGVEPAQVPRHLSFFGKLYQLK